jgi:hypothetical protein
LIFENLYKDVIQEKIPFSSEMDKKLWDIICLTLNHITESLIGI